MIVFNNGNPGAVSTRYLILRAMFFISRTLIKENVGLDNHLMLKLGMKPMFYYLGIGITK